MSLAIVNKNSNAQVTITWAGGSPLTYLAQFVSFSANFVCQEIDITTLASEVDGEFDQTSTRCILGYGGIVKTGKDGSNGGAIHNKLSQNPANVVSIYQWATGASLAATVNYNNHFMLRNAGIPSTFSGGGISTGVFVLTWPES